MRSSEEAFRDQPLLRSPLTQDITVSLHFALPGIPGQPQAFHMTQTCQTVCRNPPTKLRSSGFVPEILNESGPLAYLTDEYRPSGSVRLFRPTPRPARFCYLLAGVDRCICYSQPKTCEVFSLHYCEKRHESIKPDRGQWRGSRLLWQSRRVALPLPLGCLERSPRMLRPSSFRVWVALSS